MPRSSDEKIALMHREYGRFSGVKCRTCPHLRVHCNGDCTRVWYKCEMFGYSNGPGTDWRSGNEACGAFKIDPAEARRNNLYGEVYRRVSGTRPKQREPELEGQLTMEI